MAFRAPLYLKPTNTQHNYVYLCYAERYRSQTIHVGNTRRISLSSNPIPPKKAWLSQRQFPLSQYVINNFYGQLLCKIVRKLYEDTIVLLKTDALNYRIILILKQLKFRLSLRHVSVRAGTIFRELSRA